MAHPAFADIGACVFDAYGTLFDVNSAAARRRDRLGAKADRLAELWRVKQLQYTWLRSLMGVHADFWKVTGDALDFAMAVLDIEDQALRNDLMELYLSLDAYPEVKTLLARLKRAGFKTAILSNGSPDMLAAATASAGLADLIDEVLSIEAAGIFKPHPSVYQLAVDRLGVPAARISFQSANAWDAVGAAQFGFRVAWCNRFGQPRERLGAQPHAEIKSLDELPALLGI
ncbi:MAG: haloacid dehalogenase type II [Alphaproteobacteria bacterium]|nr:haloacid dehalogenase type II [Alphaproteobacteria bacterium]